MTCPHCGKTISSRSAAKALGAIGGRASGVAKRRDVDYLALARLSHQKRRENAAKKKKVKPL